MSRLKETLLIGLAIFGMLTLIFVVQHESQMIAHEKRGGDISLHGKKGMRERFTSRNFRDFSKIRNSTAARWGQELIKEVNYIENKLQQEAKFIENVVINEANFIESKIVEEVNYITNVGRDTDTASSTPAATNVPAQSAKKDLVQEKRMTVITSNEMERKGELICDGKSIDSEVIYWKIVPGDAEYESPITPHHGVHHDRYVTFEYDQGGWNNVRMSMECLLVVAHAMGRTLVIPPQQHLYLLGQSHKDAGDKIAHDEMGFEDFFNIDVLGSHKGLHVLPMKELLVKEALTGGLHGIFPPGNTSDVWGTKLWSYLDKVADATPEWTGKFLAMPDRPGDFSMKDLSAYPPQTLKRMRKFGGERQPVFYDEKLQQAHHIHFPADGMHRLLQHHYAFAFFADKNMQSFYRRFVRDYMRYKDNIQCSGDELLRAVRADALALDPNGNGSFYALHIRRGDFQFKEVKLSAEQIVKNLVFPGTNKSIIPAGALVYLSTDDPLGVCRHCLFNRKPCESYPHPRPVGCPDDPSWNSFVKAGWNLRFLDDYRKLGLLKDVNPNLFGMIESIVCSKATVFAGTFHSTFTGYIHRLRGYHGLAESSYYHTTGFLMHMKMKESVGHGFSREWRAGWTDDAGGSI